MTFNEWYQFNFVTNKIMNIGDIFVKIMRKKSINSNDKMLDALMRVEDAVGMFGDYTISFISFDSQPTKNLDNYKTLSVILYKE